MILATKSALRTGVEVKVLHIRERGARHVRMRCAGAALVEAGVSCPTLPWNARRRGSRRAELGYFYNACTQIATQSALLAGFCYSGLTYLTYVDGDICERTCAELTFPLAVITAMGFAMLALWQATLASMFAPGLALRGPPGSMDMAVNHLIEEYQGAMRLYIISLFVFLTTALLWSWTWDSWLTSAAGTLMILVTMRMIYVTIVSVADEFDFDSDFTPEFDFQNTVTGGWAPPTDPGARSGGSRAAQRLSTNGAPGQPPRRSRRADPWYFRNPVLRYLLRPMFLPTPMTLY